MKQTAVEWLESQLDFLDKYMSEKDKIYLFEQAKQMEAEQTKGGELATFKASSQTELSDEVLKKTLEEINKQPMTFVPNEISDEEIEENSKFALWSGAGKYRQIWIEGAKWYREQLKQRQ